MASRQRGRTGRTGRTYARPPAFHSSHNPERLIPALENANLGSSCPCPDCLQRDHQRRSAAPSPFPIADSFIDPAPFIKQESPTPFGERNLNATQRQQQNSALNFAPAADPQLEQLIKSEGYPVQTVNPHHSALNRGTVASQQPQQHDSNRYHLPPLKYQCTIEEQGSTFSWHLEFDFDEWSPQPVANPSHSAIEHATAFSELPQTSTLPEQNSSLPSYTLPANQPYLTSSAQSQYVGMPPDNRGSYASAPASSMRREPYRSGGDTRGSYRSGRDARDSYRPHTRAPDSRLPPSTAPYSSDTYRPPHGDFTFRTDKPAGIQDGNYDSYRPTNEEASVRRRGQRGGRKGNEKGPANRGGIRNGFRGGRGARGGRQWFTPASRPMLQAGQVAEPSQKFEDDGVTYRALKDLSDSDEADMSISGGSSAGAQDSTGSNEPAKKRARMQQDKSTAENSVPKWSNPDPYTVLPPTEETGKRKDVVQLIRKARIASSTPKPAAPAEAADFIAFDSDLSTDTSEADKEGAAQPPPNAPTGPRLPAKPPAPNASGGLSSQPQAPTTNFQQQQQQKQPASFPHQPDMHLGARKRTHDDQLKPNHVEALKRGKKPPMKGHNQVDARWRVKPGVNPTPWVTGDYSAAAMNPMIWLHREVQDFYDFVKPTQFEARIREDLIQKLNDAIRKVYRDAQVVCFGSFRSDLYLPDADMDLAFCSDSFLKGTGAKYDHKKFTYKFANFLTTNQFIWDNNLEVIAKAKVPLCKYLDKVTGLRVDVSFENLTGITAVDTFLAWREKYPSMPILVTVIKHFLAMRGLNEPVNGGIGGFSVTCMVMSLLQAMPEVQSGTMDQMHHLGELLFEFFDLYGNRFNYTTTAISVNPPGYIPKTDATQIIYRNPDRLSIIDPNNPSNDISGGSSNTKTIQRAFAEARSLLSERMTQLSKNSSNQGRRNASILEVIMKGDYSPFTCQRAYMRELYEKSFGPIQRE